MTAIREALAEALSALETIEKEGETTYPATVSCAIDAARAALAAQPEQGQFIRTHDEAGEWVECPDAHGRPRTVFCPAPRNWASVAQPAEAAEPFGEAKLRAAIAAERERCIDIVAMHGGSVEIEAAIRRVEGA